MHLKAGEQLPSAAVPGGHGRCRARLRAGIPRTSSSAGAMGASRAGKRVPITRQSRAKARSSRGMSQGGAGAAAGACGMGLSHLQDWEYQQGAGMDSSLLLPLATFLMERALELCPLPEEHKNKE